jgi:hypothetical protein
MKWCWKRRYMGYSGEDRMRRSNVALRLQPSLLEEALRTEQYFRERAGRAGIVKAKRILKRAGKGNRALPGDEL